MKNTILSDYPRSVTSDGRVLPIRTLNTFCHHSGMVVNRIGTRGTTTSYYRDQYAHNIGISGTDTVIFDSSGSATASKAILDFIVGTQRLPPNARILDVGCGRGSLLREFAHHSDAYYLAGIEPNKTAAAIIQKDSELSTLEFYEDLQDSSLVDNYDLILLTNVIEHVESPRSFLQEVVKLLKPRGLLYVGSPNFVNNPLDLLIADHLTRYTPLTISALFHSLGLTILESIQSTTGVPMSYLLTRSSTHILDMDHLVNLNESHIQKEYDIARGNQDWLDSCLDRTATAIANAVNNGIPIILYGTGSLWPGLLALEYSLEADIDCIVDDNPNYWHISRWGHSIQRPYDAYTRFESHSLSVISANPCYSTQIARKIHQLAKGDYAITGANDSLALR